MIDFTAELAKYNLDEAKYEACLKDIRDKVLGNNDLEWQEIVSSYNLNTHYDVLRKSSSAKPFGSVFVGEYFKNKRSKEGNSEDYLSGLRREQQELRKERQKTQDERMELQRLLREQSRRESFIDLVKRVFEDAVEPLDYMPSPIIESDNDLIVCLSDLHAGIGIDNFWNTYDSSILKQRLCNYIDKISEIQNIHHGKVCYLVLGGDLISGWIHRNLRLENNENVVEQIKLVSKYLGEFVEVISAMFERVYIVSVSGNHSRLSPAKEEHLKGEELDALIPFYLGLMFKNNKSITISENIYDDTIFSFKTRGDKLFYGVHGDKDKPSNVVKNLTLMTGVKPDGIIVSHLHHNALTSEHGVKIISTGSGSGTDNFCVDHRITGRAEQAIIVTNSFDTVKCFYDVGLD